MHRKKARGKNDPRKKEEQKGKQNLTKEIIATSVEKPIPASTVKPASAQAAEISHISATKSLFPIFVKGGAFFNSFHVDYLKATELLSKAFKSKSKEDIENAIQKCREFLKDYTPTINEYEEDKYKKIKYYVEIYRRYLFLLTDATREIIEFDVIEEKKEMINQFINMEITKELKLCVVASYMEYSSYMQSLEPLVDANSILTKVLDENEINREQIDLVEKEKLQKNNARVMIDLCIRYISIKLNYYDREESQSWDQYSDNMKIDNCSLSRFLEYLLQKYFYEPFEKKQWGSVILAYDAVMKLMCNFDLSSKALALSGNDITGLAKQIELCKNKAETKQAEETQEELENKIHTVNNNKDDNIFHVIRDMSIHLNHELPYLETKLNSDVISRHIDHLAQLYYEQLTRYLRLQILTVISSESTKFEILHTKKYVTNKIKMCYERLIHSHSDPAAVEYYKALSLINMEIFNSLYVYSDRMNNDWLKMKDNLMIAMQILKEVNLDQCDNPDQAKIALINCVSLYLYCLVKEDKNSLNLGVSENDKIFDFWVNFIINPTTWGVYFNYFMDEFFQWAIKNNNSIDKIIKIIYEFLPNHPISQVLIDAIPKKNKINELEMSIQPKKENLSLKFDKLEKKFLICKEKFDKQEMYRKSDISTLMDGFDDQEPPKDVAQYFLSLSAYYEKYTNKNEQVRLFNINEIEEKINTFKKIIDVNITTSPSISLDDRIRELTELNNNHFNDPAEYTETTKSIDKLMVELNEFSDMHAAMKKRIDTFVKLKEEALSKQLKIKTKTDIQVNTKQEEIVKNEDDKDKDKNKDKDKDKEVKQSAPLKTKTKRGRQEEKRKKQLEEQAKQQQELEREWRQQEEQEKLRLQQEEQERLRLQQEEQERLRLQQEEQERLRLQQEEQEKLRLQQEEQEKLRLQQEEQEKLRLQQEEQERLRLQQEEQERLRLQQEEQERLRLQQEEQERRIRQDEILLTGVGKQGKQILIEDLDYAHHLYEIAKQKMQDASTQQNTPADDKHDPIGMYLKGSFVLRLLINKFCDIPEIASQIAVGDIDCHFLYNKLLNIDELVQAEGFEVPLNVDNNDVDNDDTRSKKKFCNYIKPGFDKSRIEFDITMEDKPGYVPYPISPIQSCYAKFVTEEEAQDPNRDCVKVGKYYLELVIPAEYRETIINTCNGTEFLTFPPHAGEHKNWSYIANKLFDKLQNAFPLLPADSPAPASNANLVSYSHGIDLLQNYYADCFDEARGKTNFYSELTRFYKHEFVSDEERERVYRTFKCFFSGYLDFRGMKCDAAAVQCANEYMKFVNESVIEKNKYPQYQLVSFVDILLAKCQNLACQPIYVANQQVQQQQIHQQQVYPPQAYQQMYPPQMYPQQIYQQQIYQQQLLQQQMQQQAQQQARQHPQSQGRGFFSTSQQQQTHNNQQRGRGGAQQRTHGNRGRGANTTNVNNQNNHDAQPRQEQIPQQPQQSFTILKK